MGSFDRGTGGEDCPRSCNTSPFRVEELGVVAHVSDPLGIARQTYDLKSLADTVDARYGAAQVSVAFLFLSRYDHQHGYEDQKGQKSWSVCHSDALR